MDANLDKIAKDLYGKIQTRFKDIKIGDENAGVLSKKEDIPKARFFEFEYEEDGEPLGTIAITLDPEEGIVVQVSGDLVDDDKKSTHHGAYKFIRSFRQFAKDRLLNFDVQNIGKSNLDKRDYQFQAKRKEMPTMPSSIMENKLYGNARMSYQDLGEARLVVKHSQPVNTELPAGRTMYIDSIYIENAQGERFRYPHKHLNGARALAEHIKNDGNPYDAIGKYIIGLSEELASLRKFKTYVSRQSQLSEAMGVVTGKVAERMEEIKKEISNLQRPAYYGQFAESFVEQEENQIPEAVISSLVDRLTIRTFNEELKSVFPYIYKFVNEDDLPIGEIGVDDILGEKAPQGWEGTVKGMKKHKEIDNPYALANWMKNKGYKSHKKEESIEEGHDHVAIDGKKVNINSLEIDGVDRRDHPDYVDAYFSYGEFDDGTPLSDEQLEKLTDEHGDLVNMAAHDSLHGAADDAYDRMRDMEEMIDPEAEYESFMESIVSEDNDLFSSNKDAQQSAIEKLNQIMTKELKGGPEGINAIQSLKGLIDDPEFLGKLRDIDPDLDVRPLIQQYVLDAAPEVAVQLHFGGEEGGSKEAEAPPAGAPTPAPEAPPEAAGAMPPGAPPMPPEAGAMPPAPVAESAGSMSPLSKIKQKIIKARECGASLETKLDFGSREMTLHDAIRECGMTPMECGFEDPDVSPVEKILKFVSGFYNREEGNFPLGGERIKIKVKKAFEDGEFGECSPDEVHKVFKFIDMKDRPKHGSDELSAIVRLSGNGNELHKHPGNVDEDQPLDNMANIFKQFQNNVVKTSSNQPNLQQQMQQQGMTPDEFANLLKRMKIQFGDDTLDMSDPNVGQKMKGIVGNVMKGATSQVPNQNVQIPGGQINPADMMKAIMQKLQFDQ